MSNLQLLCRMMENSIAVPSAETEALSRAAKEHSIVVCIGCSERVASGPGRGTLYNTQLTFSTSILHPPLSLLKPSIHGVLM